MKWPFFLDTFLWFDSSSFQTALISEVMAGPLTKSMDLKDIACTGGNEFILGERKKDIDCTLGNDSGLGEEVFPAEDIVAAFGPKLMFRYKIFG